MRLIDADEVLARIENPYQKAEIARWLRDAPTIEERKTGRWIESNDGWDGTYFVCSNCWRPWKLIDGDPRDNGMNYCPNCGADMRGDDHADD